MTAPNRVASLLLALLVVSTVVASPAAAATTSSTTVQPSLSPDCGESQVEKAAQFLIPAYALYDAVQGGDECDMETVLQGNQEQEMQDVHANANTMEARTNSSSVSYGNALNDARTVAWTKAECATLEALEANATQEQTRVQARAAVSDYYSRMLTNVMQDRNAVWQQIEYNDEVVRNESLNSSTWSISYMTTDDRLHNNIGNRTVAPRYEYQLPNGSTVDVYAMRASASGTHIGGGGIGHFNGPMYVGSTLQNTQDYGSENVIWVRVHSTYNGTTVLAYDGERYWEHISTIENQNTQMLSNVNTTVNGLYGDYVRGNLNISDYRSVQCTAEETGVGVNSTYYSIYAVSALAKAGAEIPDLNQTGSMTIEYPAGNNSTYTGLLVSSHVPGDSWQTGQTYDPSAINGSQSFHVEASNESFYLTENFTVVGLTDSSGDNISSVNTTQYNYRTDNFSELGDKLDRLIELRQEEQVRIEEASNPDSGGTIGWPGFGGGSLGMTGGIVIVGIVAVVLFAARTYLDVLSP